MPHQALAFVDLPWAEFVFAAFEGIVGGFEFQLDRSAFNF
jgi:hypothetical protein